ncbi:MAG: WYL domain-containing protein [Maricaulis sp.]|uniref:helix-turn-helix transcriptional regulator n=1 Tax=Maricaulis sp. TaxID=1486257 RepID=UPI0025C0A6F3|nr:WYL domain-containing protein [Maricaulis sp.]MDM7983021.1 WYL domain-containing protein [Maricaulis sp.]
MSKRLRRLELLAAQLKQESLCTVKELAAQHGVSERTIARDLDLMREQGLPIDADRGRGGGVRLDRNWGVGRLNLAYHEAVDLLISIEVAERMNSPLFLANLGTVKRQLVASFSPERRHRIERLKSRILIGVTASTQVQSGFSAPPDPVVRHVHQGFIDQQRLAIRYRREDGAVSKREIEPHYLLLKYPVWYVIAMDGLRDAPRTFRCDRILESEMTDTGFRLLPKEAFDSVLAGNELLV